MCVCSRPAISLRTLRRWIGFSFCLWKSERNRNRPGERETGGGGRDALIDLSGSEQRASLVRGSLLEGAGGEGAPACLSRGHFSESLEALSRLLIAIQRPDGVRARGKVLDSPGVTESPLPLLSGLGR